MPYSDYGYFPRSTPRAAKGGIKSQSRKGEFGTSWWAKRWTAVLESFNLGGRLTRGKSYARQGQVLNIDIETGIVKAKVQGSRPKPYSVSIEVNLLSEEEWSKIIAELSKQALFVAKLLAGEMPQDIEAVFDASRLSLFPKKRGDLETECSCPDASNPCKHIAAVYYLLGEEFDRDPFLIFRLRGMSRDQLLNRLGAVTQAVKDEEPALPREPLTAENFWSAPALPEDFYGAVQSPPVSMAMLRRLGKFPFWRGERTLEGALEAVYLEASKRGLERFLANGEPG
jgi:uncharacterized Zn finger protein